MIKNIIKILNNVMENIENYYKIYCDIINSLDIKRRKYEILYNINEIYNNVDVFQDINNIINTENVIDKFTNIFEIHKKISYKEYDLKNAKSTSNQNIEKKILEYSEFLEKNIL